MRLTTIIIIFILFTHLTAFSADYINFSSANLTSIAEQTTTNNTSKTSTKLTITGNQWLQMSFNYNVTPYTMLEFKFSSNAIGEIHAIGIQGGAYGSSSYTHDNLFQLFGTQTNAGQQQFHNYSSGTKSYNIRLNDYYTGTMKYLVFAMDHDVTNPAAQSVFDRVRIYEKYPKPGVPSSITSSSYRVDKNEDYSITFGASSNILPGAYYYLQESINDGPYKTICQPNGGASTYTCPITGKSIEGIYKYKVAACNGDSCGSARNLSQSIVVKTYIYTQGGDIDFNAAKVVSIDGQTTTNNINKTSSSLNIVGNQWLQISFPYEVTANTILEFEFSSTAQGEVHGLGFLSNSYNFNHSKLFQLFGTETPDGSIQQFNNYSGGTKNYKIRVGDFYTGRVNYLLFAMDHDIANPTGNSVFSNVKVYEELPKPGVPSSIASSSYRVDKNEDYSITFGASSNILPGAYYYLQESINDGPYKTICQPNGGASTYTCPITGKSIEGIYKYKVAACNGDSCGSSRSLSKYIMVTGYTQGEDIDFNAAKIVSIEGQTTTYNTNKTSSSLNIIGDQWLQMNFPYEITPNTILEFNFSSTVKGEVHGLGFLINEYNYNHSKLFQLFGTEAPDGSIQQFNDYSNGTKNYKIRVGEYYTGTVKYLIFAMDHDVTTPTGNSVFSNVKVYEELPQPGVPSSIASSSYLVDINENYSITFGSSLGILPGAYYHLQESVNGNSFKNICVLAGGQSTYTCPITGKSAEGVYKYQVAACNGNSCGSARSLAQAVVVKKPYVYTPGENIDFTANTLISIEQQTKTNNINTTNNSLRITGNQWLQISFPFEVTANTILEFDFLSTAQGEVHGLGFLSNPYDFNHSKLFQLFGTEAPDGSIQQFNNYSNGTQNYKIRVGDFYSGRVNYLIFAMDHDIASPTGNSLFSNVKVYEEISASNKIVTIDTQLLGAPVVQAN